MSSAHPTLSLREATRLSPFVIGAKSITNWIQENHPEIDVWSGKKAHIPLPIAEDAVRAVLQWKENRDYACVQVPLVVRWDELVEALAGDGIRLQLEVVQGPPDSFPHNHAIAYLNGEREFISIAVAEKLLTKLDEEYLLAILETYRNPNITDDQYFAVMKLYGFNRNEAEEYPKLADMVLAASI